MDSKVYMENTIPRTANTTLKENKARGLTLPDFKTYCKATVIIYTLWVLVKKPDKQISGTEERAQR